MYILLVFKYYKPNIINKKCFYSNDYIPKEDGKEDTINLQAVGEGKVQLSRTPQEKDRLPDRISLDR